MRNLFSRALQVSTIACKVKFPLNYVRKCAFSEKLLLPKSIQKVQTTSEFRLVYHVTQYFEEQHRAYFENLQEKAKILGTRVLILSQINGQPSEKFPSDISYIRRKLSYCDISYCLAFTWQLMSSWNDKGQLVASYLLFLECIYY